MVHAAGVTYTCSERLYTCSRAWVVLQLSRNREWELSNLREKNIQHLIHSKLGAGVIELQFSNFTPCRVDLTKEHTGDAIPALVATKPCTDNSTSVVNPRQKNRVSLWRPVALFGLAISSSRTGRQRHGRPVDAPRLSVAAQVGSLHSLLSRRLGQGSERTLKPLMLDQAQAISHRRVQLGHLHLIRAPNSMSKGPSSSPRRAGQLETQTGIDSLG